MSLAPESVDPHGQQEPVNTRRPDERRRQQYAAHALATLRAAATEAAEGKPMHALERLRALRFGDVSTSSLALEQLRPQVETLVARTEAGLEVARARAALASGNPAAARAALAHARRRDRFYPGLSALAALIEQASSEVTAAQTGIRVAVQAPLGPEVPPRSAYEAHVENTILRARWHLDQGQHEIALLRLRSLRFDDAELSDARLDALKRDAESLIVTCEVRELAAASTGATGASPSTHTSVATPTPPRPSHRDLLASPGGSERPQAPPPGALAPTSRPTNAPGRLWPLMPPPATAQRPATGSTAPWKPRPASSRSTSTVWVGALAALVVIAGIGAWYAGSGSPTPEPDGLVESAPTSGAAPGSMVTNPEPPPVDAATTTPPPATIAAPATDLPPRPVVAPTATATETETARRGRTQAGRTPPPPPQPQPARGRGADGASTAGPGPARGTNARGTPPPGPVNPARQAPASTQATTPAPSIAQTTPAPAPALTPTTTPPPATTPAIVPPVAPPVAPAAPAVTASPAPQPAAPPAPAPAATPTTAQDEAAIRGVLAAFTAGYGSRDAAAVRRVYPSAPGNLQQLLSAARSYRVSLVNPSIRVQGDTATVSTTRQVQFEPLAGRVQNSSAPTTFVMRRGGNGWYVERVQ